MTKLGCRVSHPKDCFILFDVEASFILFLLIPLHHRQESVGDPRLGLERPQNGLQEEQGTIRMKIQEKQQDTLVCKSKRGCLFPKG